MRYPRVLFYTVNGLGLGHVTRLLAIARKLRRLVPEAEILFFTSSEAEDVIFREGFAAFKAPSKTLRREARIRPATYARLLQTVTLNLVASFHPHVLVVDTFPAGTLQELLPVLRWDSRKVFVFRVQRREVASSQLVQSALRLYDRILVPHTAGDADLPLPEGIDAIWTGPVLIRDRGDARTREEARRRLGLPLDGRVVYISFGGGGDAAMDAALSLAVEALSGLGVCLAVVRAPLYRGSVPASPTVVSVEYFPMAELFTAFDVAVSAAGYNTTMELLHHGIPAALVPFPRQVDDQHARARTLAQRGAALCVDPLTRDNLLAAVQQLLNPERATVMAAQAVRQVPENGAERAASAIAELLS